MTHWCFTIWNGFVVGFVELGTSNKATLSCWLQKFFDPTFLSYDGLWLALAQIIQLSRGMDGRKRRLTPWSLMPGLAQGAHCSVPEDTFPSIVYVSVRSATCVLLCGQTRKTNPSKRDDHDCFSHSFFLSLLPPLLLKFFEILLSCFFGSCSHPFNYLQVSKDSVAFFLVINWHRC